MLPEPRLVAVHHGVALLVLQEHPHHGGFRHDAVDAALQPGVLGGLQHRAVEAGPVVAPHGADPPLDGQGHEDAAVNGEIPALGVAAQHQLPPGILRRHGLHIRHRLLLGGDLRLAAQEEVLLPPGDGVVRPPEGEVEAAIPQLDRHGGELLRLPHVQVVAEAVDLHLPEAGALRHFLQQRRDLVRHQHAHAHVPALMAPEEGLRRRVERHALPLSGSRHDPREVHEGELRQDQVVHLVEGGLGQGQVPPPVEIIQNIGHRSLLSRPRRKRFVLSRTGRS